MEKDNDLVLPKTVTELLELLNKLYPEKTPDLEFSKGYLFCSRTKRRS